MPAASNKTEPKTSAEAMDATKQFLQMVEKKVRNLEKRKGKLDLINAKQDAGETLEKEQKDAIKHYSEVIANLELAREMQKSFIGLATDLEKQQKKQAKREKQERNVTEIKRIVDVLQVQNTLDALGNGGVREHFKTGKYGAVVLTDDNLTAFDELYQLISPSREGEKAFSEMLNVAAEHILSLVESRDRPVAGSTYKELMELVVLINGCGYFECAKEAEAETTAAAEEQAEEVEEAKEEEERDEEQSPAETNMQNNASEEVVQDDCFLTEPVQEEEVTFYVPSQSVPPPVSAPIYQSASQAQPQQQQHKVKPLPEIMSTMRSNFRFIQDSEIEMDSPHMDPAVVAAQPMMRKPSANSQPPQMIPTAFPAPPIVDQTLDEPKDPLSLSQQSLSYSNASQTFVQSLSQSGGRVGDALFQGPPPSVEEREPPQTQQQMQPQITQVPHMLGQNRGPVESPVAVQFDLPPSIPLPPSQSQQEAPQINQEKKFQLNAAATEFQSMYTPLTPTIQPPPTQAPQPQPPQTQPPQTQLPHPQQTNPQESRPIGPSPSTVPTDFVAAPNFAQAAGDFSQVANNYQSGGFQRGGRGVGPSNFRGGQRGARGGNAGNALQNGFSGRSQNGNSRPVGNRGGQSFQGFPPRNDYRPEGYQGFNSNGFGGPGSGGPYQKRGMRGAPRGSSGPPRGAAGNRGGMSRPGNQ